MYVPKRNGGLSGKDGGLPTEQIDKIVEMSNVATHPEVPNEEAEIETIGALEDQYGG
jgi:hypothetical protein